MPYGLPGSPADGQVAVGNNDITYVFSSAIGAWVVKAGVIGSSGIDDGGVMAVDIADESVTLAKMAPDALAALLDGAGKLVASNNLSDVADAGTSRTNLGLAIGSNVQAYDETLQSMSALGTAANRIAYTTGVDTWAEALLSAFARTLIDDADAASMRATLGDVAALGIEQAWTAQQSVTLATLSDAANIDWNVSAAQKAKVTLADNRTMNAVTNAVEGTTYTLWVIQDGTGGRTLSWTTSGAGSFDFGTDGAPVLTTTASKADLLAFEAISIGGTLKLRFMGIKKGFA